jgi:peptidoglycan-associated lipoprotein
MKMIAVALISLLIVACSSTQKMDTSQETRSAASTETASVADPAAELQMLQQENVYFDFDKSDVKAAYQNAIQKQADFIKAHPNDVVTLEGNTDERGSREYNHSLGNRRATAVENSLQQLGVPAAQIRTISYGEDKPRLSCHAEKCWKENRRVDFAHTLN